MAKAKTKVSSGAGKITFDATRPLVAKAIEFGVANATTMAAHAVVEQFHLDTSAIVARQASVDHARDLLNAIRKRIATKRGTKFEEASASRVSEYKKALSLSSFACLSNLIATVRKFEVFTIEDLFAVAKWMAGTRKEEAQWKMDTVAAPTADVLSRVIARSKKRATKSTPQPSANRGPTGMPHDPERAFAHVAECALFALKALRKELNAGEIKLIEAIVNNTKALKPAAKRIKAARAEKAAAK